MFAKVIDHEISKIILWVIGIPTTLMVLSGFVFGGGLLLFFFNDAYGFATGLTSLFSVLGVLGAWLRILNTNQSLSARTKGFVVAMMFCGVISTVIAGIYTYREAFPVLTPALLALASFLGVILILSTVESV